MREGFGLLSALVTSKLAASNGEARRHIRGGAIRVNDTPVSDERRILTGTDLNDGVIKLSMGKKRHALLKAV